MTASRVLRTVVATVAIASLSLACGGKKDSGKAGGGEAKGGGGAAAGGGGGKAAGGGGGAAAGGGGGAAAGGGGAAAGGGGGATTAWGVFPKDTDVVVGINGDKLRESKLWQQFSPMIAEKAKEELGDLKDSCGIDALTAINAVVIGANTKDSENAVIVVKTNGLKRADLNKCAQTMATKKSETLEITDDGKLGAYKDKEGKTMWVGWLDDTSAVISPKAEDNKDYMTDRLAGKDSLSDNKDIMDLLNNVDTKATLWFAIKSEMLSQSPAAAMGMKPTAVFGSLLLTAGLKLDMGVRFGTADEAKAAADQANQAMEAGKADPNMGKFISKVSIAANGADLIVKLDLNEQEFNELLQMVMTQLGPMLQMMMGGGM